ncbi:MAG: radical SAM protein, partial [Fibrobacteria bacterium]|nr:radical SAM protein [Fibrobacteria bacterium]
MLIDSYERPIRYLRISLTDRCNFSCSYCKPREDGSLKPFSEILRLEELAEIARAGVKLGITKIRLTGGEPLIRKNIEYLIGEISQLPGLSEVVLTTNGALLTQDRAERLKKAGLNRVNISLDSLDPQKFRNITGSGNVNQVLKGIEAAIGAGLIPVKINMVISRHTSLVDLNDIQSF